MGWKRLLAITIATFVAAASPATAATFKVTSTDDAGECENMGDGTWNCGSIRSAISTAAELTSEANVIEVPAGLYQLTGGPLQINTSVTLRGASARTTTIAASPSARVFDITATTATIAYLTVRGGEATAEAGFHGGNIRARSSTVELDHVRVTGGLASSGGGIANDNGAMLIHNSLIDHNVAGQPFDGNDGGGIVNFGGDSQASASMTIRDSTIAFNTARLAGGIASYGSTGDSMTLEGVTIARNTGGDRGIGGISVAEGSFQARGSMFASNQDDLGASNCASPGPLSNGGNVDSGGDCNLTDPTDRSGANAALDAALSNQGGETDVLAFAASSDAIDIGGVCSSLDQTDLIRPVGAGCDAGAWEYRGGDTQPPPPPPIPTPVPTPVPTPTATPVAGKSVAAEAVKGKVLVKLPGTNKFVALDDAVISNGAEVDTRNGVVEITRSDGEVAKFYDGLFKISQSGGITTVTLSEKLTGCPAKKKQASAAAKKPKTRKLWGDGKGKFRTRGQYSAATVRGTKWFVQDTCTSTITKVSQGVVSVRDDVKKKNILLRKGRSYTARPKR
jgi:hypothetical protein